MLIFQSGNFCNDLFDYLYGKKCYYIGVNLKKKTKQKRSSNRVSNILDAAKEIIELEGLKSFNTNYIAKKCNISIGSLYQYFQSTELIFFELINREYNLQISKIEQGFNEVKNLKLESKLKTIIETSFNARSLNSYFYQGEKFFDLKQAMKKKNNFEDELFKKSKVFLQESSKNLSPERIEQALIVIFNSVKNASSNNEELKNALLNLGVNFLSPQTS